MYLQSGPATHLIGFEDENLGCSPGWWAATVATYCLSRPGNYPNSYLQNLANEWPVQTVLSLTLTKHTPPDLSKGLSPSVAARPGVGAPPALHIRGRRYFVHLLHLNLSVNVSGTLAMSTFGLESSDIMNPPSRWPVPSSAARSLCRSCST